MSSVRGKCRLFLRNLSTRVDEEDVRRLFEKFGTIVNIKLLRRSAFTNQTPYAFLEFQKSSAMEAMKSENGVYLKGTRIAVEFARHQESQEEYEKANPRGNGQRHGDQGAAARTGRTSDRVKDLNKPNGYNITVSGLPSTARHYDLKDHMTGAGKIRHTAIYKDGTGIVSFETDDRMKKAVRLYNQSRIKTRAGECTFITVREHCNDHHPDQTRQCSRSRERSRSRIALHH